MDLWIYQEIMWELKPDLVIECGTYKGGGAYYLASLMDLIGKGEIVTIDMKKEEVPKHKRIKYIIGSTDEEEIVEQIEKLAEGKKCVLVILDSNHSRNYVLKELNIYNKFVTPGSYMVVEDSDLGGHPTDISTWPEDLRGPHEAIEAFMKENDEFIIDKQREKFLVGVIKDGYLKKI